MDLIVPAFMFILPAVGAYLLSRMTYTALKKRQKKWAMAAAIPVFIITYLAMLFAIVVALVNAGYFHR